MIKTFTQDDVIKYIYKETSKEVNQEIENAFLCDAELRDFFMGMSTLVNQMDNLYKMPSDNITDKILEYSRSYDLHSV